MPNQKNNENLFISLFEEVYSSGLHRVEFYAHSFLGDMEEARSVAQEAFTKLWERRTEVDFSEDVLPFVMIIARNSCLNILRRRKIKGKYDDFAAYRQSMFNLEVLEQASSVNIYEKEVQGLVKRALEAMPQKVKETFLLSRDKNYKNREIAELQGIGISTVEFRLASAVRIFRRYLKDYLHFLLWFLLPNV